MNETVRMANIAPGIFRKTLGEINFLGTYIHMVNWSISNYSNLTLFMEMKTLVFYIP